MLQAFALAALAGMGAVMATRVPHAFIGCYAEAPDSVYVGTASTAPLCADLALAQGYRVAHFLKGVKECYASNNGAAHNKYLTGFPTACPLTGYTTYATGTPYNWLKCPSSVVWDKREEFAPDVPGYDFNSGAECLAHCAAKGTQYVITMPGDMNVPEPKLRCFCAKYHPVVVHATCTTGGFFMYDGTSSIKPTPSGFKRRAEAAARLIEEEYFVANPVCPSQKQGCFVSANPDDGYECIDTQEELESCGGCRHGIYSPTGLTAKVVGVNCLRIKGVDPLAVSCVDGQCQVGACARGYSHVNGECVRSRE